MKTKSVKYKHFFQGTWGCMISLPKAWLEEMGWAKDTNLVLEWHPYKEEIVIMKDIRKLAPIREKGRGRKVERVIVDEATIESVMENNEPEIEVDDEEADND